MIDYEELKDLFYLLKVKNVPKKHWSNTSRSWMENIMHVILLVATKTTCVDAPFIPINVNEITMIDNT
jgi:hypothetical protein